MYFSTKAVLHLISGKYYMAHILLRTLSTVRVFGLELIIILSDFALQLIYSFLDKIAYLKASEETHIRFL